MATLLEKIENEPRTHARLSEYIKIKHGFAFKGEYFSARPTKDVLVTPGNFAIGGGFKADKFKYYASAVPEDYILKAGDLVVTMTDLSVDADTLGYSALIPNDSSVQFLHNQRVGLVQQIKEGIDLGFLYYLMRTREYQSYVVGGASGSTVKHTSPERIASFEYDFPSVPTQRKIAEILSAYDEKIENNNKIIKNLEMTAQALFDEWFVEFQFPGHEKVRLLEIETGEMPEGWSIEGITEIADRAAVPKMYQENELAEQGTVPVYDQSSKGLIGFHEGEPSFIASVTNPILSFGDHTCRVRLICEPFSLGPNTIPLREKGGYSLMFVFFLIKDVITQREYKRHWNELATLKFIVPPPALTRSFANQINPLVTRMLSCEKENGTLDKSLNRLLAELI